MRILKYLVKLLPLAVSAGILFILYRKADYYQLKNIISFFSLNEIIYLFFTLIIILLFNSLRWVFLCQPITRINLWHGITQVAASNSLDSFIPFKASSFTKAFFLTDSGTERGIAFCAVIYEKLSDLFGAFLILQFCLYLSDLNGVLFSVFFSVCFVYNIFFLLIHFRITSLLVPDTPLSSSGLLSLPAKITSELFKYTQLEKTTFWCLIRINCCSVLLWTTQAVMFYLFFRLIQVSMPFGQASAGMLIAFFGGWLPISYMGLGVRETIIVQVYQNAISYDMSLVLGMLSFIRTLIPALLGLFFLQNLFKALSSFTLSQRNPHVKN